jgi:hypothetical protein
VHDNKKATVDNPKQDQTLFVVPLAVVHEIDREWIAEGRTCLLEADAVFGQVRGRLGIVPLENRRRAYATVYP